MFEAYWQRLQSANPGLRDPENTMSIRTQAFRDVLQRAYEQGRQHAIEQIHREHHSKMPDFFKEMFGGKR